MGHLHWHGGWRDTPMERLYSACSTARGQLATIHGACGYPGETLLQARGTREKTTSRPAQLPYSTRMRVGRVAIDPFHASWRPAEHDNSAVKDQRVLLDASPQRIAPRLGRWRKYKVPANGCQKKFAGLLAKFGGLRARRRSLGAMNCALASRGEAERGHADFLTDCESVGRASH
jgi:hypothetical protein